MAKARSPSVIALLGLSALLFASACATNETSENTNDSGEIPERDSGSARPPEPDAKVPEQPDAAGPGQDDGGAETPMDASSSGPADASSPGMDASQAPPDAGDAAGNAPDSASGTSDAGAADANGGTTDAGTDASAALDAGSEGEASTPEPIEVRYGWPLSSGQSSSVAAGAVIAYQIQIPVASTLDSFGVSATAAGVSARWALYNDVASAPANLVASVSTPSQLGPGAINTDVADVALAPGSYWIAIRVSLQTSINKAAAAFARSCTRSVNLASIYDAWPLAYGSATCTNQQPLNVWIDVTQP